MSSHYSNALDADLMCIWAQTAAKDLFESIKDIKKKNICLLYSGMSGVAYASFLSSELNREFKVKCNHLYIRKLGEKTHSQNIIEYTWIPSEFVENIIIFVDDFMESGNTFITCMRKMLERFHEISNLKYSKIEYALGSSRPVLNDINSVKEFVQKYRNTFQDVELIARNFGYEKKEEKKKEEKKENTYTLTYNQENLRSQCRLNITHVQIDVKNKIDKEKKRFIFNVDMQYMLSDFFPIIKSKPP